MRHFKRAWIDNMPGVAHHNKLPAGAITCLQVLSHLVRQCNVGRSVAGHNSQQSNPHVVDFCVGRRMVMQKYSIVKESSSSDDQKTVEDAMSGVDDCVHAAWPSTLMCCKYENGSYHGYEAPNMIVNSSMMRPRGSIYDSNNTGLLLQMRGNARIDQCLPVHRRRQRQRRYHQRL